MAKSFGFESTDRAQNRLKYILGFLRSQAFAAIFGATERPAQAKVFTGAGIVNGSNVFISFRKERQLHIYDGKTSPFSF